MKMPKKKSETPLLLLMQKLFFACKAWISDK